MSELTESKPVALKRKKSVGEIISDFSMPIVLIVLLIAFSFTSPVFLTVGNMLNILQQNAHAVVCACAVMIIMISGGCDLSIGYQMSVAAVLMTKAIKDWGLNPWLAIVAAIILCSLLGTFNGYMGIKLKSSTMIVTLGTMSVFRGIANLITNGKTLSGIPDGVKVLGQYRINNVLPVSTIIMIVIVIAVGFVMSKTSVGRKVYAAGDNPEAARLAGLNVNRIKILSFSVAGVLVGIAAVLLVARTTFAKADCAAGIEFDGITACVLSGVALKGGEGTLWKVIVAVFALAVLGNGFQLIGLGEYPQLIAKGAIMLGSLYLTNRNSKGM